MIIVCPQCGTVFDIRTSNDYNDFANDPVKKQISISYVARCPNDCLLTQSEVDTAYKIEGDK